jgi:prophage antirepressor-like protein
MLFKLIVFTTPANLGAVDIRVVERDGEPWFIAADVCWALAHIGTTRALEPLADDERAALSLPYTGRAGTPEHRIVNLISEAGLYSLIVNVRTPMAQAFKRWITREVLPEVRRTASTKPDIAIRAGAHQLTRSRPRSSYGSPGCGIQSNSGRPDIPACGCLRHRGECSMSYVDLRLTKLRPTMPAPSNARVAGSGTAVTPASENAALKGPW